MWKATKEAGDRVGWEAERGYGVDVVEVGGLEVAVVGRAAGK